MKASPKDEPKVVSYKEVEALKKFFTLIDKLLNLCNSYLKLLSELRKQLNIKTPEKRVFLLRVHIRKDVRSFQIIIVERRRSEDHGKKTSNEF